MVQAVRLRAMSWRTSGGRGSGFRLKSRPSVRRVYLSTNCNIVLTRDGWVKRVGQLRDVNSTPRCVKGDEVRHLAGSTKRAGGVLLATEGSARTSVGSWISWRRAGYGEPLSKQFKFEDGETVVAALSSTRAFVRLPMLTLSPLTRTVWRCSFR